MFRCKCGKDYADPLEAAECEKQAHTPSPDPITRAEALRAAEFGEAVNMASVVVGSLGAARRAYTISEAALLMRSLSDQTLLISVRRILATQPPVPFHDLLNELATRLDKALMELATRD